MNSRMFKFTLLFTFAVAGMAQASTLLLRGHVFRSVSIQGYGVGSQIKSNDDLVIEVSEKSGQIRTHYLQYNQGYSLGNKIKKITIYAP